MAMQGVVVYTDEFGTTRTISDEEAMEIFGVLEDRTHDPNEKKQSYILSLKPWSKRAENGLQIWLRANLKIAQSCTSPGVNFATLASSISLGKLSR